MPSERGQNRSQFPFGATSKTSTIQSKHSTPISEDQHRKIKRSRLSLVCLHCKKRKIKCDKTRPRCGSCTKLGRECQYGEDLSSQVSKTIINNQDQISNRSSLQESRLREQLIMLQKKLAGLEKSQQAFYQNGTNTYTPSTYANDSHGSTPPSTCRTTNSITGTISDHNDNINLHSGYSLFIMKSSSNEDIKPLNHLAFFKKDPYFTLFSFSIYLYIHISSRMLDRFIYEDWKTRNADGGSKWLTLLSFNKEDGKLRDFAAQVCRDRAISRNADVFPFIKSNDTDDQIIQRIKTLLPLEAVFDGYLKFFFHALWPSRPFVEEATFLEEISRIVTYNSTTLQPMVNLSQRSDMANIAILLIILRYSSVALNVMKTYSIETRFKYLLDSPVSIEAINTAQLCLSYYRISKKTTLQILQALLLLRHYLKDSPEDGDGVNLCNSQTLMAFIIQAAIIQGLNRDPSNFIEFQDDVQMANLRRRLWFGIVNIECSCIVLNGSVTSLPSDDCINVELPVLLRNDPLDAEQTKEYRKAKIMNSLYLRLSKMFNKLDAMTPISDIIALLTEMKQFVTENYQLRPLPLQACELERFSRHHIALNYANSIAIQRQLIQYTLEMHIYHTVCAHYESTLQADKSKYLHYLGLLWISRGKLFDLSMAHVTGKLHPYIRETVNFSISPIVSAVIFRAFPIMVSTCLHLYHARDQIKFSLSSQGAAVTSDDIELLLRAISSQFRYVTHIFSETLGLQYWSALKSTVAFRFSNQIMKKLGFASITKIANFVNDEPISERIGQEKGLTAELRNRLRNGLLNSKSIVSAIGQWTKISERDPDCPFDPTKPAKELLINAAYTNHFTQMTREELAGIYKATTGEFVYFPDFHDRCVEYETSKQALNEPSFICNWKGESSTIPTNREPVVTGASTTTASASHQQEFHPQLPKSLADLVNVENSTTSNTTSFMNSPNYMPASNTIINGSTVQSNNFQDSGLPELDFNLDLMDCSFDFLQKLEGLPGYNGDFDDKDDLFDSFM